MSVFRKCFCSKKILPGEPYRVPKCCFFESVQVASILTHHEIVYPEKIARSWIHECLENWIIIQRLKLFYDLNNLLES